MKDKRFKLLEFELDEKGNPVKETVGDLTIHATIKKRRINDMGPLVNEALNILAAYPDYCLIEFEFPSVYGKFNVAIGDGYTFEDCIDLLYGLIKIQKETLKRQRELNFQMAERVDKRNAGLKN